MWQEDNANAYMNCVAIFYELGHNPQQLAVLRRMLHPGHVMQQLSSDTKQGHVTIMWSSYIAGILATTFSALHGIVKIGKSKTGLLQSGFIQIIAHLLLPLFTVTFLVHSSFQQNMN